MAVPIYEAVDSLNFILDFQHDTRQNSQLSRMAMWLSWLERGTHNAEVGGSSPPIATILNTPKVKYKPQSASINISIDAANKSRHLGYRDELFTH